MLTDRRLCPPQCSLEQTIYTLRLKTGTGRGAGIDEPGAGVFVGLVGLDGSSFLHRVSPLNDPEANAAELREICRVRAHLSGAPLLPCHCPHCYTPRAGAAYLLRLFSSDLQHRPVSRAAAGEL